MSPEDLEDRPLNHNQIKSLLNDGFCCFEAHSLIEQCFVPFVCQTRAGDDVGYNTVDKLKLLRRSYV